MSDYSEKLAKAKKIRDEKIANAKKEYADEKRRLKAERDREKAAEKERKRQEKERAKAEKERQKAAKKEKAKAEKARKKAERDAAKIAREAAKATKGPGLWTKAGDFINGLFKKKRTKWVSVKSEKTKKKDKDEGKPTEKQKVNSKAPETGKNSQTIIKELLDDNEKSVGIDVEYPNGEKARYITSKGAVPTHTGKTIATHKEGSSSQIDYVEHPDGKKDIYSYNDDKSYAITKSDGSVYHYDEQGVFAKTDKSGKMIYAVGEEGERYIFDENQNVVIAADKHGNLLDKKGNVVDITNSDMLKNDLKAESEASRKAAELIIRREQEKMRKAAAEKQVATTEASPTDNKVEMRQMLRDHYER